MLWEGELMNCYKCGEKVNDEITLCPNCGTYLQATPELIQQAISNDQSAISYRIQQRILHCTCYDKRSGHCS